MKQVELSQILNETPFPGTDLPIAKLLSSHMLSEDGQTLKLVLAIPYSNTIVRDQQEALRACFPQIPHVEVSWKIQRYQPQPTVKGKKDVKNIIAIASGKGGVGKSTLTANLAIALSQLGATVGILDADIYGPSIPHLFGEYTNPGSPDQKTLKPIKCHTIELMSIGFLLDKESAVAWRGPMLGKAVNQLLNDTAWSNLDYLLIDLPPGTGDVQLTMAKQIPVTGAVITTTPQDLSLIDVTRCVNMFEKVRIPCFGVVENMSQFCCPNCGHQTPIFGQHGAQRFADKTGLPLLGQIPLAPAICEQGDAGKPLNRLEPHGEIAQLYREIAFKLTIDLCKRKKDLSHKLPQVVIE